MRVNAYTAAVECCLKSMLGYERYCFKYFSIKIYAQSLLTGSYAYYTNVCFSCRTEHKECVCVSIRL